MSAPVGDAAEDGKDQVALQRPGHCSWCSSPLPPVLGSALQSQLLHYLHQQQDALTPMRGQGRVRQGVQAAGCSEMGSDTLPHLEVVWPVQPLQCFIACADGPPAARVQGVSQACRIQYRPVEGKGRCRAPAVCQVYLPQ